MQNREMAPPDEKFGLFDRDYFTELPKKPYC
jgi:hypothetical protein